VSACISAIQRLFTSTSERTLSGTHTIQSDPQIEEPRTQS